MRILTVIAALTALAAPALAAPAQTIQFEPQQEFSMSGKVPKCNNWELCGR